MNTLRELLDRARKTLETSSDDALLDSQVLLAHVLGRDRSWLYGWPEHVPDAQQVLQFEQLVAQRAAGHPIAHLTGEREFWSLRLGVSRDTLVPRPETEHLIEIALGLDLPPRARVLDLGTGSGAIALALAAERRDWQITAVDASAGALDIARRNAHYLGLGHIEFLLSDWFAALPTQPRFDLILSNPPYIAIGDRHLERGDLRFEPSQALVSGTDGLDAIRHIIDTAPAYLPPGAWLWLEHGADQGDQVAALLRQRGFDQVSSQRDLAGHNRHCGGRFAARSAQPGTG